MILVAMKLVSVREEVCSACRGEESKVKYRMALEGTRPDQG